MEIYFDDLKPEIQERLLNEVGITKASEMNWDVFPIAEVDCNNFIKENEQ